MRVIAGSKKGIALRGGKGPFFRPTAQVVKGSIFDILGDAVEGTVFLDLFAGSGGVGIEALSRGASRGIFVEQDHRILKALRTNLQRCGFGSDRAVVRMGCATRFFDSLLAGDQYFDFIFADPPYTGKTAQRILSAVDDAAGRVICGTLIVEHGHPVHLRKGGALELQRERKFGQTFVSYYRYRE